MNKLGNLTSFDLDEETLNHKVAAHVKENEVWDWERLGSVLSLDCLELLIPVKVPSPLNEQDKLMANFH